MKMEFQIYKKIDDFCGSLETKILLEFSGEIFTLFSSMVMKWLGLRLKMSGQLWQTAGQRI